MCSNSLFNQASSMFHDNLPTNNVAGSSVLAAGLDFLTGADSSSLDSSALRFLEGSSSESESESESLSLSLSELELSEELESSLSELEDFSSFFSSSSEPDELSSFLSSSSLSSLELSFFSTSFHHCCRYQNLHHWSCLNCRHWNHRQNCFLH